MNNFCFKFAGTIVQTSSGAQDYTCVIAAYGV